MKNRWSEKGAARAVARYRKSWGRDLALRTYTSRLIGEDKDLVLRGGGNTSVKTQVTNLLGERIPAIFVKASGYDLRDIEPEGHAGLDLAYLRRLGTLAKVPAHAMVNALRTHLLDAGSATPSIESLMHAFIPAKYVDHTHPSAILALTNQAGGKKLVRDALGDSVIVVPYVKPGFGLAKAVKAAVDANPGKTAIVLMKHGLITFGEDARESYGRTIALVTRAQRFLNARARRAPKAARVTAEKTAQERYRRIAPVLRGRLALRTGDPDRPYGRFILRPILSREILDIVDRVDARALALTPPLTTDYLIRTKALPLWIDSPDFDDPSAFAAQAAAAIEAYAADYEAYFQRHASEMRTPLRRFDPMPRVVLLPGLGAVCAAANAEEAELAADIALQDLRVKSAVAAMGKYEGVTEGDLFGMEYFSLQHAKLPSGEPPPLDRSVALVTGAAGAIGAGICEALLAAGCHVAASDQNTERLGDLVAELSAGRPERIVGVPIDVTRSGSVEKGFSKVIDTWGGIDLLVINAGIAHVSPLADMDQRAFRRTEQVNVEGTLHVISEAARHFRRQGTGGDIVLLSTKNVFAPGANFGAYSATKAAAHQLARIASLELAPAGVRVNMVAPDAVFSHGRRKSGLWAEVGPDRMRARGLTEQALEDYYRDRNLLKAKVTATHVARAVLFFATRQTPTTGATIPVDGGLPDSTPR